MRVLHIFSEQSAAVMRQIERLRVGANRSFSFKAIGIAAPNDPVRPPFEYERLFHRPFLTSWQIGRRARQWNAEVFHIWLPGLESRIKSLLKICRATGAGVVVSDQHGLTSRLPGSGEPSASFFRASPVSGEPSGSFFRTSPGRQGPIQWLASSQAVAASAAAAGIESPHVVRWATETDSLCERSLSMESPTVVAAGRLVRHKRLKDLIWAVTMLEQVTPICFQVAGNGPLRDRLEVYRDQVNVYRSTRFVGHDDNWWRLLANATCYWSASSRPGQSLSLAEAMSAGTAVVAVDTPTNRELIRHGENGFLVSPGSIGFARQARVLMRDESLRAAVAEAARETSRQVFDVTRMAGLVQEHYDEALRKAA